jgi:hypothetical protein
MQNEEKRSKTRRNRTGEKGQHTKNSAAVCEWFDLARLTAYAAVSRRTLFSWIGDAPDALPACKVKGKIFIRRADFDSFMEKHKVKN